MKRPHRTTALRYIREQWRNGENPLGPSIQSGRRALALQCELWGQPPVVDDRARRLARHYFRATMYADRLLRTLDRMTTT